MVADGGADGLVASGAVSALGPRPGGSRSGYPDRHGRTPRLFLLHRDLAAGSLLPDRPAADRRHDPVHDVGHGRPRLVRFSVLANGLYRPVRGGRAQDHRRPQSTHRFFPRPSQPEQDRPHRPAQSMLGHHRRSLRHGLRAVVWRRPANGPGHLQRPGGLADLSVHSDHRPLLLPVGRLCPRTGLRLYVPLCPLPVGHVRRTFDDRLLRSLARRTTRPCEGQQSQLRRSRPLRRLQDVRPGLPHRHRHPSRHPTGLHRLRPVRGRLQQHHGPLRLAGKPDLVRFHLQHGGPQQGRPTQAETDPAAHPDLYRRGQRRQHRHSGQPAAALRHPRRRTTRPCAFGRGPRRRQSPQRLRLQDSEHGPRHPHLHTGSAGGGGQPDQRHRRRGRPSGHPDRAARQRWHLPYLRHRGKRRRYRQPPPDLPAERTRQRQNGNQHPFLPPTL